MNSPKTELKVNKHDCVLAISRILDSRSKGYKGYHFVVVFLRARQYILTVSLSTKVYKHLKIIQLIIMTITFGLTEMKIFGD